MEFAALIALSVLIGALVIIVAMAIGKQKRESSEENEEKKDADSTSKWTMRYCAHQVTSYVSCLSIMTLT